MNKESNILHNDAGLLIKSLDIVNILKKYGEVRFIGSYKYGVMTSRDVDVHVYNPNISKDDALKLLNELASLKNVAYLKMVDFVSWRKFLAKDPINLPQLGYFVGLRVVFDGHLWKVDMSLVKKNQAETYEYDNFFNTASQETKDLIIKYKQRIKNEGLPYYSKDIYRAVMNQCAGTYQELLKYLMKNNEKN